MSEGIAFIIPVLNRAHRVEPLVTNFREQTPEPYTIMFAASDPFTIKELDRLKLPYLRDNGDTWPRRINRLFHATTEPYVFLGADDILFHPNWLPPLMEAMCEVDGVVVPCDTHNPNGTLALVSRDYIDSESGCVDVADVVLYEGYAHCWCDSELFSVAKARKRHRYVEQSVVEHLHHGTGKSPYDETYAIGHATFTDGQHLYSSRQHLWESL